MEIYHIYETISKFGKKINGISFSNVVVGFIGDKVTFPPSIQDVKSPLGVGFHLCWVFLPDLAGDEKTIVVRTVPAPATALTMRALLARRRKGRHLPCAEMANRPVGDHPKRQLLRRLPGMEIFEYWLWIKFGLLVGAAAIYGAIKGWRGE